MRGRDMGWWMRDRLAAGLKQQERSKSVNNSQIKYCKDTSTACTYDAGFWVGAGCGSGVGLTGCGVGFDNGGLLGIGWGSGVGFAGVGLDGR